MVVGTILTTTLDVTLNLTIWTVKKVYNGVYYFVYGDEPEDRKLKKELTEVKKELENIKIILENQTHLDQANSKTIKTKENNEDNDEIITEI
jgi:valyl-tRNA synthetase